MIKNLYLILKKDIFGVHVQYPEKLHDLHNHLPFQPERMKTDKVEKLVANLQKKFKANWKL